MLAACDFRNSRQLEAPRRGAGSRSAPASSRRMLVAETMKPSLRSSPQIRRWPQHGFSRANRSASSRISGDSGGRPTRPGGWRHFRRTSALCQRSSVSASPAALPAVVEADALRRRPEVPGQPCQASAAPPGGAGSPAHGAARAARCLSRPGRAGSEQARRARTGRRGRGRRRPCRRSSQAPRPAVVTPILAPFRRSLTDDPRPVNPSGVGYALTGHSPPINHQLSRPGRETPPGVNPHPRPCGCPARWCR